MFIKIKTCSEGKAVWTANKTLLIYVFSQFKYKIFFFFLAAAEV